MSLKENVDYIKNEVSAQESMLENVFKVEKLYKKYKGVIFGTVALVVVALIGTTTMEYMDEQNKIEANTLFNKVLENPNDTASLNELKSKNQKLYEIAQFKNNQSANVNVDFFKELAAYSQAMEKSEINKISQISQNQNFLLKDFAVFNKALIQAQNGKYKESKETLKLIPVTSNISGLSKTLEHFLITK